jgi:nicotinate dehydrogenase subunit A
MFQINGQMCDVQTDGQRPLLSVLRDELGLHGPKFGCGQGECGACMVLVDGVPQTACNLPVWAVQDKQITTLEGLGTAAHPHPVQAAFIQERAGQCGYCLSGVITSAVALLRRNPQPDDAAMVQALEPHLCRCGAHQRMLRAVRIAAHNMAQDGPTCAEAAKAACPGHDASNN